MTKSLFSQVFFALAVASVGCAPPSAEASPEPTTAEAEHELGVPAVDTEAEAALYLDQAKASTTAARHELTVEHDTSEALNEIDDAQRSLRTARMLILALPPTRAAGR